MAIKQLTEEQVRTWSVEQKDRWWLENVFKGDVAQFTIRAGVCGFLLGFVLSATNLYVGAKTGWTLGVGITSVILAFVIFKTRESRLTLTRPGSRSWMSISKPESTSSIRQSRVGLKNIARLSSNMRRRSC